MFSEADKRRMAQLGADLRQNRKSQFSPSCDCDLFALSVLFVCSVVSIALNQGIGLAISEKSIQKQERVASLAFVILKYNDGHQSHMISIPQ
jgi:hypothetical protein